MNRTTVVDFWLRTRRPALLWVLYVAISAIVLRPILITAIVADDFINPFVQFHSTGLSPIHVVQYGWNSARSTGHFNYSGQLIGAAFNYIWLILGSVFGIRFSTIYALTKLSVFIFCACEAARFIRTAADLAGLRVTPWSSRIATSTVLFLSIQLHNLWSNDPVGSYPLSGFLPAALGFLYLSLILRLSRSTGWRMSAWVGLFGVFAVTYYEVNAAAVAAASIPMLWVIWNDEHKIGRSKTALNALPAMVIPTVVAIFLQIRAAPGSSNYEGTSLAAGGAVRTTRIAIQSTLPSAGWSFTRDWTGGQIPFSVNSMLTLALLGSAIGIIVWICGLGVERTSETRFGLLLWLSLAPIAYWFAATVLQASTIKVQSEVDQVGEVYNFYAIGATALAGAFVTLVFALSVTRFRKVTLTPVLVAFGLFGATQLSVNEALSQRFNKATIPNQNLLVAYSEQLPESDRCLALTHWSVGAWPEYYEVGMIQALQVGYERFHDEPFCEDFVRPAG